MKKLAIILGIVIGLVVVAVLAVEFLVDLNAFAPQIVTPMEEALGRKVALGDLSLSVLQRGATVQNISIFEQDQSDLFVNVEELVAQVKLLPLLSRKIEVANILLKQPNVTITRHADGHWNFNDLLGQPVEESPQTPDTPLTQPVEEPTAAPPSLLTQTPSEQPPSPTPVTQPAAAPMSQFTVETFQLRQGAIRFVDNTVQMTTELNDITGDVTGIAIDSPIKFNVAAAVNEGKHGKIKASGQVGPIPADLNLENLDLDVTAELEAIDLSHFQAYYQQGQQAAMQIEQKLNANMNVAGNLRTLLASNGNVSVGEVQADVSGTVEHVQTSPKLDLTVSLPNVPWENVLELLPPELAATLKDLNLTGLGDITVKPKGTLDQLAIAGEFDLSESGLQYQSLFAKPEALNTTLAFDVVLSAMNAVEISALTLTLGEFTVDVSGSVANFSQPELDLQVSSNAFPLDKLLALFPALAASSDADAPALSSSGSGQLSASVKGSLSDLAIQALVNLDNGRVTYGDMFTKAADEPGNITLAANLSEDAVNIEQFLVNLGAFELTASGNVGNLNDQPEFDLTIETNQFDIAKLLAQAPVAKQSLPPELSLAGLGKLTVKPKGTLEQLHVVGALDMTKGEIVFGDSFTKPTDMPGILEFDTTLTQMNAVEIRKVRLNLNEVILDITGTITDLQQGAALDLHIISNQFALNQLSPLAAPMGIETGGTTELDLVVKTSLKNIDMTSLVTGSLRLHDVGIATPQLPKPVQKLNAQIQIDGDTVTLQNFSAAIGESSLSGQATIADLFAAPVITFDLQAPVLNLDELMPPAEETARRKAFEQVVDLRSFRNGRRNTVQQTASPSSLQFVATAQTSPPALLQQLTSTGKVTVTQGQVKNVHFSDLNADVDFTAGVLRVENLFFDLYDGTYEGLVTLDLNDPDPRYEFQSKLVHVDANPLLKDGTSVADVLYGFVFADTAIQGQGFTMDKIVQHLSGRGAFEVEQGKIATLDLWSDTAAIFQTLGSVANIKELTRIGEDLSKFPAETQFSRLAGSFVLKNGEAGSSDMILEIPEQDMHLAILLEGALGLNTELDFIGKIRFAPESKYYRDIERTFRDFKEADGSIELPFPIPIGGTLLEPEISRRSLQQSLTAFGTELAKHAAKKEVENQVIKLLQDTLGEKSPTPTPLPTVTPTPPEEAAQPTQPPAPTPTPKPTPSPKPEEVLEEIGKDLLKDLFK